MTPPDLADYDVDPQRGFLPNPDPLRRLPPPFDAWDQIGQELPKWLVIGQSERLLRDLPQLDVSLLQTQPERERAMLLLSHFAHGYINDAPQPRPVLPATLAVPWCAVAELVGRPPILAYAANDLWNWGRLETDGPLDLTNLYRLQEFTGGMDDDWFVVVHVAIEALAGPGLAAMVAAQDAALADDADAVAARLLTLTAALEAMLLTLRRMPERCDPYVYYHRVRSFMFGWMNNPALPDGLIYEGVAKYGGRPQQLMGETGAQSAVIPFLDVALGISPDEDPLNAYMVALQDYMPARHRAFIREVGPRADVRGYVLRRGHPALRAAYNAAIEAMVQFRQLHLEYAASYVFKQGQLAGQGGEIGTGGTPFMRYLKLHLENVRKHAVAG